MANESNGVATGVPPRGKLWAVVCTGFIGPDYDPAPIADATGKRCPVIVRLFPDKAKAESMLKRLQTRHSKVSMFLDRDWHVATPIYGLCETDLDAPLPRVKAGNAVAFSVNGSDSESEVEKPGRKARRSK